MQPMTVQETAAWLQTCERAVILIHQSPDGDCIGAGYALAELLHQMGKQAAVCCSDPIPERYAFLLSEQDAAPLAEPDCVLAVDVADPKLLGRLQEPYGSRVDLCIDHHISNTGYAARLCLDGQAAAACQVLYEIMQFLPVQMTQHLATCLYTGMATDTGCFQYDNTGARTHQIVAELMTQCPAVPYGRINRNLFAVKSLGRLQMEKMLTDQLESHLGGACMMICVTQALLKQFGVAESELDGVAGFPLQVEGAQVGITIKEREPNAFKVSMRSADWVNVSAICQTLGGGGHVKAAGCLVRGTLDEVRNKLLDAVEKGMQRT